MRELNEALIELKSLGIYPNGIIIPSIVAFLSIIIPSLIKKLYFTKWFQESGLNLSEIILSSIKNTFNTIVFCFRSILQRFAVFRNSTAKILLSMN